MAGEAKEDTKVDVAAITKSVTEQVLAGLKPQLDEFAEVKKNVGVIASEMAASKADAAKAAAEAAEAAKAGKDGKDAKAGDAAAITPEAINKLVTDGVAAAMKARDDEAGKKAAREAKIGELVKTKLAGNAELGKLLTGATDEELAAQAEAIAAEAKKLRPDFGGASKDGGDAVTAQQAKAPIGNLSPGTAKFAESIKLPA